MAAALAASAGSPLAVFAGNWFFFRSLLVPRSSTLLSSPCRFISV
jgi:hypothetical protein